MRAAQSSPTVRLPANRTIRCGAFSAVVLFALVAILEGQDSPSAVRLEIRLSPRSLSLYPDAGGTGIAGVHLAGAAAFERPGYPRIPCLTRTVALPAGARIGKISATAVQSQKLQGVSQLIVGQHPRLTGDPLLIDFDEDLPYLRLRRPVGLDPAIVKMAIWPPEAVEVVSVREIAGYDLAVLRIFPARWSPGDHSLTFQSSLDVVVQHTGGTAAGKARTRREAMEREVLAAIVDNPMDVLTEIPAGLLIGDVDYLFTSSTIPPPTTRPSRRRGSRTSSPTGCRGSTSAGACTGTTGTSRATRQRISRTSPGTSSRPS